MDDFCTWHEVICNRWIDEVRGVRCVLQNDHAGPCSATYPARAGEKSSASCTEGVGGRNG